MQEDLLLELVEGINYGISSAGALKGHWVFVDEFLDICDQSKLVFVVIVKFVDAS